MAPALFVFAAQAFVTPRSDTGRGRKLGKSTSVPQLPAKHLSENEKKNSLGHEFEFHSSTPCCKISLYQYRHPRPGARATC